MLTWKVFIEDINSRKIKKYDIFASGNWEEIARDLKESTKDKQEFEIEFKNKLMHQYWSRCEYEVIITSWPPYITSKEIERLNGEIDKIIKSGGRTPIRMSPRLEVSQKIDVFEQLMLNWNIFIDYVYSNV